MVLAASQIEDLAYQVGLVVGIFLHIVILLGIPTLFIISLIKSFKKQTKGWISLCVFSGFLFLIPVSLVSYGIFSRITEYTEYATVEHDITPGGEITSKDGLFKLKAPSHWKILSDLNEAASVQVGSPVREQYLIVLTDMKEDFDGSLTEHASITLEHILTGLDDAQVDGPEHLNINGCQSIRYYITGKIDLTKIKYVQTTISGQKAYYQILAWTIPSKSDEAFEVFDQVVRSFQEFN